MLQKIGDALLIDAGYLKYGEMYYFSMNDFTDGIDLHLRHMRPVSMYSDPDRFSVTMDYYYLAGDFFIETVQHYADKLTKEQKAMILEIIRSLYSENEIAEGKKNPELSDAEKVSAELNDLDNLIKEFE